MDEQNEPTTGEIVRALRYCADVNSICGDACPAHIDEDGCRTVLMQNAADRLESQEREIERLRNENHAMFRSQMDNQGVWIPDGSEYQPITFFGHPVQDAIRKIEEHAALTARAESAERERDAAKAYTKRFGCLTCTGQGTLAMNDPCGSCREKSKWEMRGLPQDGDGK